MREKVETSLSGTTEVEYKQPNSETSLVAHEIELASPAQPADPEVRSMKKRQEGTAPSTPQTRRKRSTTDPKPDEVSDRKRSLSLNSFDNMKVPKSGHAKLPFFVRLSRPWSRRLSSAS